MKVSRETPFTTLSERARRSVATRKRIADRRLEALQQVARRLADAALLAEICLHPQAPLLNRGRDTAHARGSLHSARLELETLLPVRACRGCGCTDNNACMTPSGPCYWAAPDLCSKCAAEGRDAA